MNSNKATLRQEGGTLFLGGDITYATVTALYQQLVSRITVDIKVMDCSGVGSADSTAVSLLLFYQLKRAESSLPIQLVGINEAMGSLIELYDVKGILFNPGTA